MLRLLITVVFISLFQTNASSSSQFLIDSTEISAKKEPNKLSPSKVALITAILPGSGQFYNKQYYKIPIVYGLLGGIGYFTFKYHNQYLDYKQAYRLRTDSDPLTLDKYDPTNPATKREEAISSEQILIQMREDAHRFRDLTAIFFVVGYTAVILDAYVFAHLSEFDITDNLTLKVAPSFMINSYQTNQLTPQINLSIRINK